MTRLKLLSPGLVLISEVWRDHLMAATATLAALYAVGLVIPH